jgi:hypothetical protein
VRDKQQEGKDVVSFSARPRGKEVPRMRSMYAHTVIEKELYNN